MSKTILTRTVIEDKDIEAFEQLSDEDKNTYVKQQIAITVEEAASQPVVVLPAVLPKNGKVIIPP